MTKKLKPVHPGEILREEFMLPLRLSMNRVAMDLRVPGAVIILPGNTPHFHWAKSCEYVTQVTAMGTLGLEYLSAKDDPRNNNS